MPSELVEILKNQTEYLKQLNEVKSSHAKLMIKHQNAIDNVSQLIHKLTHVDNNAEQLMQEPVVGRTEQLHSAAAELKQLTEQLNERTSLLKEKTAQLQEYTAQLQEYTTQLKEYTTQLKENTR